MSILLPLYIYPLPGAWDPLYAALEQNPTTNFTVVINPHSGPGNGSVPDARYTAEIPKIKAFPNVRTLGYVATNYTDRPIDEVISDVMTYAGWPIATGNPEISVDGIFFDETPNTYKDETHYYLKAASEVVWNSDAFKDHFIVHNPGNIPFATLNSPNGTFLSYINLANVTVIFEQTFDKWLDRSFFTGLQELAVPKDSIGVIIHSMPFVAPSVMDWIVSQLEVVSGHLFLVGFQDGHYNKFSPLFADFVHSLR